MSSLIQDIRVSGDWAGEAETQQLSPGSEDWWGEQQWSQSQAVSSTWVQCSQHVRSRSPGQIHLCSVSSSLGQHQQWGIRTHCQWRILSSWTPPRPLQLQVSWHRRVSAAWGWSGSAGHPLHSLIIRQPRSPASDWERHISEAGQEQDQAQQESVTEESAARWSGHVLQILWITDNSNLQRDSDLDTAAPDDASVRDAAETAEITEGQHELQPGQQLQVAFTSISITDHHGWTRAMKNKIMISQT